VKDFFLSLCIIIFLRKKCKEKNYKKNYKKIKDKNKKNNINRPIVEW
jgi:hypothetical protein